MQKIWDPLFIYLFISATIEASKFKLFWYTT